MRTPFAFSLLLALLVPTYGCATAPAQASRYYTAYSKTAYSITGDITLSPDAISFQKRSYSLALVQKLDAPIVDKVKELVILDHPQAQLYKLMIPASTRLIRGNSLCGKSDATWLLVFEEADELRLAFFSGEKPPVLDYSAISNSADLCGTFNYTLRK